MERIKSLGRYQKVILLLLIFMVLVFAVLYIVTINQVGIEYKGVILVLGQEDGKTTYSGRIHGKQATFCVSDDNKVVFQHGDKVYGPYTAKADPSAIPEDAAGKESMAGVEVRCAEKVLFRGGVRIINGIWYLTNEDGTSGNSGVYITINGVTRDENGKIVDLMEPSVETILRLMDGPELTHKGQWRGWLYGLFVCFITSLLILFADELFYLRVSRWIDNPDSAEPSDWEITGRYISYAVLSIMSLVIFIMGLR